MIIIITALGPSDSEKGVWFEINLDSNDAGFDPFLIA